MVVNFQVLFSGTTYAHWKFLVNFFVGRTTMTDGPWSPSSLLFYWKRKLPGRPGMCVSYVVFIIILV